MLLTHIIIFSVDLGGYSCILHISRQSLEKLIKRL